MELARLIIEGEAYYDVEDKVGKRSSIFRLSSNVNVNKEESTTMQKNIKLRWSETANIFF